MSLALRREHAILLIFMSLFGIDDTASLCLRWFFCNANVKYTSTFQCCYEQRLLFLSLLDTRRRRSVNTHTHTHMLLESGWSHCCLQNCHSDFHQGVGNAPHSSARIDTMASCSWSPSQRCSIGLRSGSRNQKAALGHGALSCWKQPSEDGSAGDIPNPKGHGRHQSLWHAVAFKRCSIRTKGSRVCPKKNMTHTI